jgi:hypothetical protein
VGSLQIEPPKEHAATFIDVLVWAAGIGLIGYLKLHYGHDLGRWIMSLWQ